MGTKFELEQENIRLRAERNELAEKLKKIEIDAAMTESDKLVESLVKNLTWTSFSPEEKDCLRDMFEQVIDGKPDNVLFFKKLDKLLTDYNKEHEAQKKKIQELEQKVRDLEYDKPSSGWNRRYMPPYWLY